MTLERPNPFLSKWAENALNNQKENVDQNKKTVVIPPDKITNSSDGRADIPTGFPAITMTSVLKGGVPPWGSDHNGILYKITEGVQWTQAGGAPIFNQELCDQIKGYPKGAVLQSQRFPYVLYINMYLKYVYKTDKDGNYILDSNEEKIIDHIDNNNILNPDYKNDTQEVYDKDEYWVNNDQQGNGWAIVSILSDNKDNISFLTDDFRILTKVAGAKSDLYVRPSYENGILIDADNGNTPYLTVQAAINAVPDGGTATIHLYAHEDYYTTKDNLPNISNPDNRGWNIGNRKISIVIYGNEKRDSIAKQISDAHKPENSFCFENYKRTKVFMPYIVEDKQVKVAGLAGNIGSVFEISGLSFEIMDLNIDITGQRFNGAHFSPASILNFHGCEFAGLGRLPAMWGGWGGSTTSVKFDQCKFTEITKVKDTQKNCFFWLSDDILSLVVVNQTGSLVIEETGVNLDFYSANADTYLGQSKNYMNFTLKKTGFTNSSGGGEVYTPGGLQTYLPLTID